MLLRRPTTTLFLNVLVLYLRSFVVHDRVRVVFGSETTKRKSNKNKIDDGNDEKINFVKLEDMTNEQLESICTNRGFELVKEELKDESSGNTFSWEHHDYLEAAQQCLDVEAEMERMLKERPNIVKELEKERDEMLKRKKMLEVELAAKLRQKEQLQEEKDRAAFVDGRKSSSSSSSSDAKGTSSSTKPSYYKSVKKDKIQPIPNHKISEDRLNYKDLFKDLRDQVQRDLEAVSNFLLPKKYRGPLNEKVVRPLIRVAKDVGTSAYDFLKRYLVQLIRSENGKKEKS